VPGNGNSVYNELKAEGLKLKAGSSKLLPALKLRRASKAGSSRKEQEGIREALR